MSLHDGPGCQQHHPLDAVFVASSEVILVEPSTLSSAANDDANFTNLEQVSDLDGATPPDRDDMQPRLRAFRMADGRWVTTDRVQLELCRRLEKDGVCRQVRLDVLPLNELQEENLRGTLMACASNTSRNESTSSGDDAMLRVPGGGYQVLDEGLGADEQLTPQTSGSEHDRGSISSASDDSSSECDWSDDDEDSSEENSEGKGRPKKHTEQDTTDTETECLL